MRLVEYDLRFSAVLFVLLLLYQPANSKKKQKTKSQGVVSDCKDSQQLSFVKLRSPVVVGRAEIVVHSQRLQDCAELCRRNEDGAGNRFACAGFDYESETLRCMLSSSTERATSGRSSTESLKHFRSIRNDAVESIPLTSVNQTLATASNFNRSASVEYSIPPGTDPGNNSANGSTKSTYANVTMVTSTTLRDDELHFDKRLKGDDSFAEMLQFVRKGGSSGRRKNIDEMQRHLAAILKLQQPQRKPKRKSSKKSKSSEKTSAKNGFYWKLCVAASPQLSADSIAFEQFQDLVLLRSTDLTVKTENVQLCLETCLKAEKLHGFACRSTMFYYESGDCLLNSLNSATVHSPDQSLSSDTENLAVDYFERRAIAFFAHNYIKLGKHVTFFDPIQPNNHLACPNPFDFSINKILAECARGNVPQYMKVSNMDIAVVHDLSVQPVSLEACETFCSHNRASNGKRLSCKAFAYEKSTETCFLIDDDIKPSDESMLPKAGIDFYEKICLAAPQTCVKQPAFEKVPEHVLVGFAQIVIEEVLSEDACLTECIKAPATLDFTCLSLMYYYESNECILNFDTRIGLGEFFSNETNGFKVNYYDNLCAIRRQHNGQKDSSCPGNKAPTFVQMNQTAIAELDTESFSGLSIAECLGKCHEASNFTCRSMECREGDLSCTISYADSKIAAPADSVDQTYFERHCIEGSKAICGKTEISFEAARNVQLVGAQFLNISGVSLDECLSFCLHDPGFSCASVNFLATSFTCQLNNQTFVSAQTVENANSIYMENKCKDLNLAQQAFVDEVVAPVLRAQVTSGIEATTQCNYGNMRVTINAQQPFTGLVYAKNKYDYCRVEVNNERGADLYLSFPNSGPDCGVVQTGYNVYSAIIIVQTNNMGIPGLVTNDDRFFNITCDYSNAQANKVQVNGPGLNIADNQFVANLYPGGKIYMPDPVQMYLQREGDSNHVRMAVLGEQLQLTWKYITSFSQSNMGVFIKHCNASRGPTYGGGYGQSGSSGYSNSLAEPEPLRLIQDGCPAASVQSKIVTGPVKQSPEGYSVPFQSFRFDGSKSVRITCLIDMCEGQCNPTACAINGQQQPSWGKRRKRASEAFPGNQTNNHHVTAETPRANNSQQVRTKQTSFTFQVVDKLPDYQKKYTDSYLLRQEMSQNLYKAAGTVDDFLTNEFSENARSRRKQVCLRRGTFLGIFLFIGLLCVCQVIVIATYLVGRWAQQKKLV